MNILSKSLLVYALPPFLCTHSSHDRDVRYRGRLLCSALNEKECPTV